MYGSAYFFYAEHCWRRKNGGLRVLCQNFPAKNRSESKTESLVTVEGESFDKERMRDARDSQPLHHRPSLSRLDNGEPVLWWRRTVFSCLAHAMHIRDSQSRQLAIHSPVPLTQQEKLFPDGLSRCFTSVGALTRLLAFRCCASPCAAFT